MVEGVVGKRGRPTASKKDVLSERLKEEIVANVPVYDIVGAAPREAGMGGLNATSRWNLLTPNPIPIPKPVNVDSSLRQPTERYAPVNPHYGYDYRFVGAPFAGNMEKMEYMNGKFPYKRKKGKGYTPSRNKHPVPEPEPQAKGGANLKF